MKALMNTNILRMVFCGIAGVLLTIAANTDLAAEEAKQIEKTLITNANIFDGKSETLATGMSVLIEGNKIAKIAKSSELLKRGYSKVDIAKIWGGNWMRVMKEVWGA